MTIDIVVHIENKLATVKNVSVNVSDTSPRTSKTIENEDANVREKRNATNAGTLSDASRHRTLLRNCCCVVLFERREREREVSFKRLQRRVRRQQQQKKERNKTGKLKTKTHRVGGAVQAEKYPSREDGFQEHSEQHLFFLSPSLSLFACVFFLAKERDERRELRRTESSIQKDKANKKKMFRVYKKTTRKP